MSVRDLDALLSPASLALILSDRTPDIVRARVVRNLLSGGFEGAISLVGEPAPSDRVTSVADIAALDPPPDLAVLALPPDERCAALADLREPFGMTAWTTVSPGRGSDDSRRP